MRQWFSRCFAFSVFLSRGFAEVFASQVAQMPPGSKMHKVPEAKRENPGRFKNYPKYAKSWHLWGRGCPIWDLLGDFGYFWACQGFGKLIWVFFSLPRFFVHQGCPNAARLKNTHNYVAKTLAGAKTPKIRKMPNIQNLWQLLRFGVFWCHFRLWKFGDKVEPANTFETWLGPHLPDPSLHKGSEGRSWGLCIYI